MPFQSRKFRLIFITAVFVFTGTAVFLAWTLFRNVGEPIQPVVVPTHTRRLVDGVLVSPSDAALRLVGVLIDGMADGRPTVGLAKAPLVWEMPVEGGITRFLAVYPVSAVPDVVGPIRSLRPYFLDFASEVGAVLLHVGGSPEALTRAKTFSLDHLNQFFDGQYFWRSSDRSAPHNVFTSQYLISRAFTERAFSSDAAFPSWLYRTTDAPLPKQGDGVRIVYSTPSYTVTWQWNGDTGVYERSMGVERHSDADGTIVQAANVIVQFTSVEILDEVGRRRITTEGDGRALVLSRGFTHEAVWKKSAGGRTQFFDAATGAAIAFQPGTTWIEVVPEKADVTTIPFSAILEKAQ